MRLFIRLNGTTHTAADTVTAWFTVADARLTVSVVIASSAAAAATSVAHPVHYDVPSVT